MITETGIIKRNANGTTDSVINGQKAMVNRLKDAYGDSYGDLYAFYDINSGNATNRYVESRVVGLCR